MHCHRINHITPTLPLSVMSINMALCVVQALVNIVKQGEMSVTVLTFRYRQITSQNKIHYIYFVHVFYSDIHLSHTHIENGPMGMALSWRGCSLQTIPPVGRRSPLLRTRGYVILWGNRGGSVGSAFDSGPMCCRFESHLRK